MPSGECNTTADCVALNDGVVKICYAEASFSKETFFCDCSNWYGWKGEDCSQTSLAVHYFRAVLIFFLAWTSAVLLYTARDMAIHLRYKLYKKKRVTATFWTGVFIFFGALFLFLNVAIQLPAAFDPSHFESVSYNSFTGGFDDVTAVHGKVAAYCLLFSSGAHFVASLQISLSWHNVVSSVPDVNDATTWFPIKKLRTWVEIIVAVYVTVVFAFTAADFILAVVMIVSLSSLFLTVVYLRMRRKFVKMLTEFNTSGDGIFSRSIKHVQKSCQINTICLSCITVLTFVFYVLFLDAEATLKVGEFNYILFIRDVAFVFGMILLSYTAWYIHMATYKILGIRQSMPKSSAPSKGTSKRTFFGSNTISIGRLEE